MSKIQPINRLSAHGREEDAAPAGGGPIAPHLVTGEAPAAKPNPPIELPHVPSPRRQSAVLTKTPRSLRQRWTRWALFALLPLALIAGGYWYVTGGQVMSTDDAYVEADKVGVSTDVSGIVKEVDVTENQHVDAGQVLYRLDDLPFRYALDRAEAQVGIVRDDLNALKANYRDMQAQIKQAQDDVDYYTHRVPASAGTLGQGLRVAADVRHRAAQPAGAQQKLASLKQQQAAVVANLNGDPDIAGRAASALSRRGGAARRGARASSTTRS